MKCVYDIKSVQYGDDRLRAMRRMHEAVTKEVEVYKKLFETLQMATDQDSQELLRLIRAGCSASSAETGLDIGFVTGRIENGNKLEDSRLAHGTN